MSLTDLQQLKTKRNRIIGLKKIDIDDIKPNIKNIFPQNDILELKENILAEGLQKPLEVYRENDTYVIIGGHRRYAALVELYMEDRIEPDIDCIIYPKPIDSADEKLQIISSNAQRPMDEHLKISLTKELLEILTNYPNKKPTGMETRKWISGYLGCSARTAQKYINALKGKKKKEKKVDPQILYAESLLRDRFSTKVKITEKMISLSYTDIKDLNRVLSLMGAIEKSFSLEKTQDV